MTMFLWNPRPTSVKQAQMERKLMVVSVLLQKREHRGINGNDDHKSSIYHGPRGLIGETTRSLTLLLHLAPSLQSLGNVLASKSGPCVTSQCPAVVKFEYFQYTITNRTIIERK